MKKYGFVIVLLAIIVLAAGCSSAALAKDITVAQASELIEGNHGLIILDVRTPEEFQEGHLDGAINIDFKAANFNSEIAKLDTGKPYLVYCRSGKRSAGAMEVMKGAGFREIYNMEGGILAWEAAR